MKRSAVRLLMVTIAGLLLAGSWLLTPGTTQAATEDVVCQGRPYKAHIGEQISIECFGFTPNTYIFAYEVEPSGTAIAYGSIKTDANGNLAIQIGTDFGSYKEKTGHWTIVFEETGLAKSVLRRGNMDYYILGGTEGVSGASLTANPSLVHKPEVGYGFESFNNNNPANEVHVRRTFFNWVTVSLSGSGFAPGEVVSFWMDPPHGGCSNTTTRADYQLFSNIPGSEANANVVETILKNNVGTFALGDAKADASGNVSSSLYFTLVDCEGEYHIVARGNSSGAGGDTIVTVVGNAVESTATLSVNPGAVSGLFDHVQFQGSGFASNEHVSCWLSSPQGQVWALPGISETNGTVSGGGIVLSNKDTQIFANSAGQIAFGIVTGAFYTRIDGIDVTPSGDFSNKTFMNPYQSEGAIGEYSASCRGDTSGKVGIGRFLVSGNEVTP